MSAPKQGRQSPDPETQAGHQATETPAGSGKIDEQKTDNKGQEEQTAGLTSNPTHPLQEEAEKKTSKDGVTTG